MARDNHRRIRDCLCMRRDVSVPTAVGLMLLVAAVISLAGWVEWNEAGLWLQSHAVSILLFVLAGALLAIALVRAVRESKARTAASPLSWWVVAIAAAVVGGVAWGTTAWLLREADRAKDPAVARVEAIKTGLGIAAGTGGVFVLLLGVRRQWHQELTAKATELDAAEKRVTELYTKAADQIGSSSAPVRLAGLYALERVAQNNPDQRQTIVNVLCAYLRMPYAPPENQPEETADEAVTSTYRERIQEREVRLTAQRLLTTHLRPGHNRSPGHLFWADMDIDLTGATLIDFSLDRCSVNNADFRLATFYGRGRFDGAHFHGTADFTQATFNHTAQFSWATFGWAYFMGANFKISALFKDTIFTYDAGFGGATFPHQTEFIGATFCEGAHFGSNTFGDDPDFSGATFLKGAPSEVERFVPRKPSPLARNPVDEPR